MRILRLAIRDILNERIHFLCIVSLIAAIAAPVMLLLSLKAGVMGTLVGQLREDPEMRRLSIVGNHAFGPEELEQLRSWPEVGFVAPQARSIARRVEVRRPERGGLQRTALVPTAEGDPLLPRDMVVRPGKVAVSDRLAREFDLAPGDALEAIARRGNPVTDHARIELVVAHVLATGALDGFTLLMNAPEIEQVEAFYDGYAIPEFGVTAGADARDRATLFESFRIFARDIADVATLEARLEAELQTEVRSRAGEIGRILGLDRNLGRVLSVLVAVALTGLAAALAALFWSTVQRKRTTLSLLALMGLDAGSLAAIPVVQALAHAVVGSLLTLVLFAIGAGAINAMFAGGLPEGAAVAVVDPGQLIVVSLVICVVAAAASVLAARVAAGADPAVVIRMGEG